MKLLIFLLVISLFHINCETFRNYKLVTYSNLGGICYYNSSVVCLCQSSENCNIFKNPLKVNETTFGICEPFAKLGELCGNGTECENGLSCYSNSETDSDNFSCKHSPYLGVGEECDNDDQCMGSLNCVDSWCTNIYFECFRNEECPSQMYCEDKVCLPLKSNGEQCNTSTECQLHLVCNNNICINKFSLKNGDDCFGNDVSCEISSRCKCDFDNNFNESNCTCQKRNAPSTTNCLKDGCDDNDQYCDSRLNKCIYSLSNTLQCYEKALKRDECLIKNNCIIYNQYDIPTNKNSCHWKHCELEIIQFSKNCEIGN